MRVSRDERWMCGDLSVEICVGVPPTYGSEYLQDGLTCVRKNRHFGDGTGSSSHGGVPEK